MEITVLRLGHRPERDKRITTHCALVARAFGAKRLVYSGIQDPGFEESVRRVVTSWGGPFEVSYERQWKKFIQSFNGTVVHLTMYGIPEIPRISGNTLVIIGAEKVPAEVYQLAGHNIAIGSQPHSEVAALAVFLDRVSGIKPEFSNAKSRIVPMKRGKKVVALD